MEPVADVRVGTQGRIVLPRELRERLGAEEGTVYAAHVEDGRLVLESRERVLQRMRDRVRGRVSPGHSIVDELLQERRTEVAREQGPG